MKKYDVMILGGGPGGYVAAIRAAQLGKKCALVEKENLGGVCLNWGCIPTKSLLRNAEVISHLFKGETFGFALDTSSVKPDYAKAQQRSREVSARLVRGIGYLMKKNGVDVFADEGVFTGLKMLRLKKSGEELSADRVIIAAGARPNRLRGIDFSDEHILDSQKALQLTKAPRSALVIGAGAIGMEFATVWHAYGAEVTIAEMLPAALPNEDKDISAEARKLYEKQGIRIVTGAKVTDVKASADGVTAKLTTAEGESTMKAEYLLVSAGIVPNSDRIGIEKTGVKLDARGYIVVDAAMRTSVEGIYAIGDITGKLALAHVASAQAAVTVDHIAGRDIVPIAYENVPKCTYGVPETASVGLTEQQAKDKGYAVQTGMFPFAANGKAIAYDAAEGFVKIVAGKKTGEVLGVHLIGAHVTEMIAGAVGYIALESTLDELASFIHPHPTMSEAIMEAAHVAQGHGVHI